MSPRSSHGSAHAAALRLFVVVTTALLAGGPGCRQIGPEDPSPVPVPELVSVVIEYRQPEECLNVAEKCNDKVVFFASWKRNPSEFFLTAQADGRVHTGVAHDVPVNYPPRDEPYRVRIFDPHLANSLTEGFTAQRLRIGRELVTRIEGGGGRNETGYVYVDSNGLGHNAY